MAEAFTHPTAGRRRRDKGPPSMPTLPRLDRVSDTEGEHSDDSAGEKEAKRQRSEPTTPVSTSGRLPYDYDAVMGITKVGTKEVEGFGEDLDTSEYHDAAEEPTRRDESDNTVEPQRLSDFQGGYGSSSLKECIELLNTTSRIAPAPLDSGDGQKAIVNGMKWARKWVKSARVGEHGSNPTCLPTLDLFRELDKKTHFYPL